MNNLVFIERIEIFPLNIERSQPTRVSIGVLSAANNIVVKITASNALVGWGSVVLFPLLPVTVRKAA